MTNKAEVNLLHSWKLKLTILTLILTPTTAAVGAYWKLQNKLLEDKGEMNARVSAVELTAQKSFAEKGDLKDMQRQLDTMQRDIGEIKSMVRGRN